MFASTSSPRKGEGLWIADGLSPRLAGAIILNVSHGYQVQEGDDPMIQLADKLMDEFSQVTTPGTHLVDIIPARAAALAPLRWPYPNALLLPYSRQATLLVSGHWIPPNSGDNAKDAR